MRIIFSLIFMLLAAKIFAQPGIKDSSLKIVVFTDGVYEAASYPGGKQALNEYIDAHKPGKPPVCGREPDHVTFRMKLKIDSTGKVKDVFCENEEFYASYQSYLAELKKMLMNLPAFNPAKNNGVPAEYIYKIELSEFL